MPFIQDNRSVIRRLGTLRVLIIGFFLLLALKAWHLTVIRADYYRDLATRNQIRTIPLNAPRGAVVDRDGKMLIDNSSALDLYLYLDQTPDMAATRRFLLDEFGVDPELLEGRLQGAAKYARFRPVLIMERLDLNQVSKLLSRQSEHPGLKIIPQPRRLYRLSSLAAHVLGYVGEISETELEREEFHGLKPGDIVGKSGVERAYNRHLTGTDGVSQILVNSVGKMLSEVGRTEPLPGTPLRLTLDLDLQTTAESSLGDSPGAVFVFDLRTGEILAMASRPSFDPNLFATRITTDQWQELTANPDHPLQNRVIQNGFSPGSIFKLVVALAGLEEGIITPSTTVYCTGSVELFGNIFHCWDRGGHGLVRLREAIQYSCNSYFYTLGQKLGIEKIAAMSRRLGLGELTGLDLLGELSGLVPSPEWKRKTTGNPWYAGETISVSIGQGPLNVTPAQLARAIGAIGTGQMPRLHIVKDAPFAREPARPLQISEEHLDVIRDAMWGVVNQWGTGQSAQVPGFEVCGKTGTAQIISNRVRDTLSEEEKKKYVPNAWFVGFAPRHDPEVGIAVIVQRGGAGSSGAAPIAGKVLGEYYRKFKGGKLPPPPTTAPRPEALELAVAN